MTAPIKVFISYSHKDREAMDAVARCMEEHGAVVWQDTKLGPGEPILDTVAEEIASSHAYVVGLSASSNRSPWVRRELRIALTLEIEHDRPRVLPVLLAGGTVPNALVDRLRVDARPSAATDWRRDLGRFVVGLRPDTAELCALEHAGDVRCVAFSPDGRRLFTACDDGVAREWDFATETELKRFPPARHSGRWLPARAAGFARGLLALAVSSDGTMLATGGRDSSAHVWDVASERRLRRLDHGSWVRSAAFRPGDTELATASDDLTVRVRAVATGVDVVSIDSVLSCNGVGFQPGGRLLATADDGGVARVWDMATQRCLLELLHDDAVWTVAFSADGKRVITASSDRTARVWNLDGAELCRLPHESAVWAAVFDPSGTRVATASHGSPAQVWSVDDATRPPRHAVAINPVPLFSVAHDDQIWAVAFNPAGNLLATAGADRSARVWTM